MIEGWQPFRTEEMRKMTRGRLSVVTAMAIGISGWTGQAVAQMRPDQAPSAPVQTGNRANGFDYQPTPSEVLPRENAAGVRAPAGRQGANDRDLERIDRQLLQSHGLSPSSVPNITIEK
jgi:hypothetical protein